MKYLVFFATLLFAINAFGQTDGNPENWCRNGLFPQESDFRIATIKGAKNEKAYFYSDEENCPGGNNCREKSYVIAGDEVIVSRNYGKYTCSWFQPKKGSETVGWILSEKLEFIETNATPTIKDWIGKWNFYSDFIEIAESKTKGFLDVTGSAIWKGLGDNVHIGELDHKAKPSGNELKLGETDAGEYDCKVTMRLIEKFLIASDNFNCGGVNVTFSGVYKKK